MRMELTQEFISKGLRCPDGKVKIEYTDSGPGGVPGLYLEVRAARENEGVYRIRYRRRANNRLTHYQIGRTTEIGLADARRQAKQIRAAALLGGDPAGAVRARRDLPTYREFFLDSYMPHVRIRKRSHKRDFELGRRVIAAFGDKKINQVERGHVVKLQSALAAEGLAPATVNHHIKVIRYSLNLAVEWGMLEKNPASRIPMLFEDNKIEHYLDEAELQQLLVVLRNDRNQAVCRVALFLLSTGCRLNEALSATWDDVDIERRVFTIRAHRSKSRKVRSIPLNDSAIDVLNSLDMKDQGGPLFVGRRGTALTTIAKQWDRIRKAADLPHLRLHDLRHQFASFLVNDGRTLYEVQAILGHSSSKVTERYAHLSTKTLQAASESASARLNGGTKSVV